MEAAHVLEGGGVELLDRADAGAAVRVLLVDLARQVQAEQAAVGLGEDALAQLLLDHGALGREHRLVDHQRAHAVGLGEQQALEVVGRHDLVVGGDVVGGEGVVAAAHVLGEAVEGLVGQVARGLEHQVLEQVREARAALGVVLRAHPVPDLEGDVGGGGVAQREHLQAVGQGAAAEAQRGDAAVGGRGLGGGRGGGVGGLRAAGGREQRGERRGEDALGQQGGGSGNGSAQGGPGAGCAGARILLRDGGHGPPPVVTWPPRGGRSPRPWAGRGGGRPQQQAWPSNRDAPAATPTRVVSPRRLAW